ncbi:MAG TPA: RNA polymerase sigma factor [Kofleriaceae bacterium]|jgi:RNA polymerase sigma-70 factor (ECF subfamily)
MILVVLGALLPWFGKRPAADSSEPRIDPSAELVRRALAGDRRAFDALYRAHVVATHRLVTRLVGPIAERDDLVQQVFLEAFRSLHGFRGEAAFSTWLHRIAVSVAYRHLRRAKPRHDEISDDLPSLAASPEQLARQREELSLALHYLAALHPKKRIAYVLRVVEGMSLDEIGGLVGAKAPAVGQRVLHAQRELTAMVERDRLRNQPRGS